MSPEQLHGEALTPASDLFSLGAVLYDALTGHPPYAGETPEEVSAAHAAGRVPPPSTLVDGVPGRLDEAILQSLRRDPHERFASADAMEASLVASADDIASPSDDDTTQMIRVQPAQPSCRRGLRTTGRAAPATARPVVPRAGRRLSPRHVVRGTAWGLIGTLIVLGAAALVIVLGVLPLLDLGREGGGAGTSPTASPSAEPGSNTVLVPDLVGQSTTRRAGDGPRVGPRLDAVLQRGPGAARGHHRPGAAGGNAQSRPAARSACIRRDLPTASDPYTHRPSAAPLKEPVEHACARRFLYPSHDRRRRPRDPDLPRRG